MIVELNRWRDAGLLLGFGYLVGDICQTGADIGNLALGVENVGGEGGVAFAIACAHACKPCLCVGEFAASGEITVHQCLRLGIMEIGESVGHAAAGKSEVE